jgi:hypothetical protein
LNRTGIAMSNDVTATFAEVETQWAAEASLAGAPDPDAAPLAAADAAALELGIADVFDTLRAEALADPALEPTYALLAELNRLWAAPQPLTALG